MKLLILTQKVDKDDDVLGFFHDWIRAFAVRCESVIVVALYVGKYDLPSNVTVLSLGKEEGVNKLVYLYRFYKYIYKYKKEYTHVFVHMNQIYAILGGIYWTLTRKRVSLWYTHRAVTLSLRVAEKMVGKVFTSTAKGFNIKSNKVHVLGHGVDPGKFVLSHRQFDGVFHIAYIARISRIKNQALLVTALSQIDHKEGLLLSFIGGCIMPDDYKYREELVMLASDLGVEGCIEYKGSVSNSKLPDMMTNIDIAVNLSPHGALDKSVIEAMMAGSLPLVLNKSFESYFGEYNDLLLLKNEEDLPDKINKIKALHIEDRLKIQKYLRDQAVKNFDLDILIEKILKLAK